MFVIRAMLVSVCLGLFAFHVWSAEPVAERKTLLTQRGKLLLSDDFKEPLGKKWKTAKGKWEIVDGALRGAELAADMHGAVTRHVVPMHDVVIQYTFKLDGTKQTTLSINDAKGHCCRVLIKPDGFTVQKDSHDHNKTDKAAVLDRHAMPIKPGEWHTIVVEIQGSALLAQLDGGPTAFGENAAIDVKKANFGLTVAGETASFKDLRVWEASPSKDGEAIKVKLRSERAKTASK